MVNYLANCKLSAEWRFGKEPYSRAHPPPTVCSLFPFLLLILSPSSFWPTLTSRHALAEPSPSTCTGSEAERRFLPDRAEHDLEDHDLGGSRHG